MSFSSDGLKFWWFQYLVYIFQLGWLNDHLNANLPLSCSQIEGTQKLLNKDLAELISKMRLAQQNAATSLKEECKKQMLASSHNLAMDAKNLLDSVDQARVRSNLAKPKAEDPASEETD